MSLTDEALTAVRTAAAAALETGADEALALDVSSRLALTDAFLIVSANNERLVSAVVDRIEEKLHALGIKPTRREGKAAGRWVLIDFGDLVVHVQHTEEREFYALDRLWQDCPQIDLELPKSA